MNISFIVPAYNCAEFVTEAIDSIYRDNFFEGDEVIIVDDASSDGTLSTLKNIVDRYENVRLFKHNYNRGSAAAGRNTGIDQAQNELIFCLDADNILVPNSIAPLKKYMLESAADAAAFGEIHFFRGLPTVIDNKWLFRDEITLADTFSGPVWPGPSGNYLFTKTSWIKAGRYNDDKHVGVLDSWIFGFRQLASGSRMVTLPKSHYLHRVGIDSHYVINSKKRNVSLNCLQLILPYIDILSEESVEYIMSREHRMDWFEHLDTKPVLLKAGITGSTGKTQSVNWRPRIRQLIRRVVG